MKGSLKGLVPNLKVGDPGAKQRKGWSGEILVTEAMSIPH